MENPYLNKIHLEPPKGLLNDPNGLSYYKGKYHVFHQWNRFDMNHSYKEWGLFTSKDLLHWQHEGSALLPDSQEDKNGVYSGSAIVVENQLQLFYTGNIKIDGQRKSFQKKAISDDGHSFLKKSGFETPEGLTEHHRDPKVFFRDDSWWMLVGSQTNQGVGAVALYQSKDLEVWEYQGLFFEDKELNQMGECPDLLDFGREQILLICPQKRHLQKDTDIFSFSAYYIGALVDKTFVPRTELRKLDYGFDFYAPQTFKDPKGRYLMWAWMSRMTDEEEANCPTREFGYLHCLTMPREIILKDGKLYQKPLEEILNQRQVLFHDETCSFDFLQEDEVLILEMNFLQTESPFKLELAAKEVVLTYDGKELTLKRLSWVDGHYQKRKLEINCIKNLQAFLDQSAIEIFINDGEEVMSLRYFPQQKHKKHTLRLSQIQVVTLSKLAKGEQNG